jgi:hypothetical protein
MYQGGARMQNDPLLWLPIISLLIYAPIVSYLDWKYRDIKSHLIWIPLLVCNLPILVNGFLTGLYPTNIIPVMLVTIALWFVLFIICMKKGADFMWLTVTTVFCVINPVYGNLFIEPFIFFLVVFTVATFWGIWLDNKVRTHLPGFATKYGIPYLVVISAAFVASVVV